MRVLGSISFKLFWERLTSSRLTIFYAIFSVLHCIVQLVFQIQAFTINAQAADFLFDLINQGDAFDTGFAVMAGTQLRFCNSAPRNLSADGCEVIFDAANYSNNNAALIGVGNTTNDTTSPSSSSASSSISSASASSPSSSGTIAPSANNAAVAAAPTSVLTATFTLPTVTVTKSDPIAPTAKQPAEDVDFHSVSVVFQTVTATVSAATGSAVPKADNNEAGTHLITTLPLGLSDDDDEEDEEEEDEDSHIHRRSPIFSKVDISLGEHTVQSNGTLSVVVNGEGWDNKTLRVSKECLLVLNWPLEELDNTKREDIVFTCFQVWVLFMSIVALLNESIPHIVATLLTHVIATGWGTFQIFSTESFHQAFATLTSQGACAPNNLLPFYWSARGTAEIASLSLNVLALVVSAFLSWKLVKSFGWQTFKRVGASVTINRVYKCVLVLSIAIQLSAFFIMVSIALWIDQLFHGAIGHLASSAHIFKGVLITVLVLLVPWLTLGWVSVRLEHRRCMIIFLALAVGYLAGWGAMFAAATFRWTFTQWTFFGVITSASSFLTIFTFVLGIVCLTNFGKGLTRYLNAQEQLPDDYVEPYYAQGGDNDPEKVEFPAARAVPTFSAAFGSGDEVPVPSQMRFAPPALGPRFSNRDSVPFETQSNYTDSTLFPDRAGPFADPVDAKALSRNNSGSSQHSTQSSVSSTSSRGTDSSRRGWVIE